MVAAGSAVAERGAAEDDPAQRSTAVRHQFLELKNRERASALIVPRLNDQQLPYRLHDVPVADFQQFIVAEFRETTCLPIHAIPLLSLGLGCEVPATHHQDGGL